MAIRIGVQLHPQHCTYEDLATAARKADELGVDTIWTWDHFYPLYGCEDAPMGSELPEGCDPKLQGGHFEAWTLLTALACNTKNAELGHLVCCNSYRNPELLADMARTLDHVSDGRAILGIGSGWYEKDYREYGFEFGTAVGRLKDLEKSLPRVKERLGKLNPPPRRKHLPIMIGGGGEKFTLRLVAEYADMWNAFGSPDEWGHKNNVLNAWCSKVGRAPAAIERTILVMRPESLDQLEAYEKAGVQQFIWGMGKPFSMAPVERLLKWRESLTARR